MSLLTWIPLNLQSNTKPIDVCGRNVGILGDNFNDNYEDALLGAGLFGKTYVLLTKKSNGFAGYTVKDVEFTTGDFSLSTWLYSSYSGYTTYSLFEMTDISTDFTSGTVLGELGIDLSSMSVALIVLDAVSGHEVVVTFPITADQAPFDTWLHCTLTIKDGVASLYLNSQLIGQQDFMPILGTFNLTFGNGEIYQLIDSSAAGVFGAMQDIRVYDHGLSQKEINEIYKACILHYDMEDPYFEYTRNLLTSSVTDHTGGVDSYWYATITSNYTFDDYKCFKITNAPSGDSAPYGDGFICSSLTETLQDTYPYVFSGWIWIPEGKRFRIGWRCHGGGYTNNVELIGNNEWQYFHTLAYFDSSIMTGAVEGSEVIPYTESVSYYIRDLQIEMKDHPSPFTPNIRSNLDLYDSSGFGNHAKPLNTVDGNWSYNSFIVPNSPVGKYSLKLDGNTYFVTPNNQIFYDNTSQSHTVNIWVKLYEYRSDKNIVATNFNSSYLLATSWGDHQPILYLNSGTNDHYVYGLSALPLNEWTMVTYVFNYKKKRCQIYYNGILNATSYNYDSTDEPYGLAPEAVFFTHLKGEVADFKIFARDLNDKEILDLYQSKQQIDKNGILSASYFDEQKQKSGTDLDAWVGTPELLDDNAIKFAKTGIVSCEEIVETDTTNLKMHLNNEIEAKSFNDWN